jgi:phosphatidylserine/phosphatidylglycerophosphate/cardiolipin synthase-like enzyme
MNGATRELSNSDLRSLIAALRSERLAAPYPALQVARVVPGSVADSVRASLMGLAEQGFSPKQMATVFELILADRDGRQAVESSIDLVTSGPEAPGITNRDTSVVVRELFAHARESVLVIGYAVYQGQQVFAALAARMQQLPSLQVQFFLNLPRPDGDTTASEILVARFKQRFKNTQWPAGCRLPEVFYDPRSVAEDGPVRSSLHAKCIVVDSKKVFVSSANFTEAGQERNIEVGLKIESQWLAKQITTHFRRLVDYGLAKRAF